MTVCVLSHSAVSDSLPPHGQAARLLCPRDFPGKNTGIYNKSQKRCSIGLCLVSFDLEIKFSH